MSLLGLQRAIPHWHLIERGMSLIPSTFVDVLRDKPISCAQMKGVIRIALELLSESAHSESKLNELRLHIKKAKNIIRTVWNYHDSIAKRIAGSLKVHRH